MERVEYFQIDPIYNGEKKKRRLPVVAKATLVLGLIGGAIVADNVASQIHQEEQAKNRIIYSGGENHDSILPPLPENAASKLIELEKQMASTGKCPLPEQVGTLRISNPERIGGICPGTEQY